MTAQGEFPFSRCAHLENGNSPWAVMCVLAYPFTDLAFSVIRRKFVTGGDAMQPDAEHLHHVIYKRMRKLKFRRLNFNFLILL